ncbi:MAG: hypothetical protein ACREP9_00610, partial [Candidatus Dormibacteraceae bacterium]
ANAPRLIPGLTPVIDQTVAGALMMLIDMTAIGIDILVLFFRWMSAGQREDEESRVARLSIRPE